MFDYRQGYSVNKGSWKTVSIKMYNIEAQEQHFKITILNKLCCDFEQIHGNVKFGKTNEWFILTACYLNPGEGLGDNSVWTEPRRRLRS